MLPLLLFFVSNVLGDNLVYRVYHEVFDFPLNPDVASIRDVSVELENGTMYHYLPLSTLQSIIAIDDKSAWIDGIGWVGPGFASATNVPFSFALLSTRHLSLPTPSPVASESSPTPSASSARQAPVFGSASSAGTAYGPSAVASLPTRPLALRVAVLRPTAVAALTAPNRTDPLHLIDPHTPVPGPHASQPGAPGPAVAGAPMTAASSTPTPRTSILEALTAAIGLAPPALREAFGLGSPLADPLFGAYHGAVPIPVTAVIGIVALPVDAAAAAAAAARGELHVPVPQGANPITAPDALPSASPVSPTAIPTLPPPPVPSGAPGAAAAAPLAAAVGAALAAGATPAVYNERAVGAVVDAVVHGTPLGGAPARPPQAPQRAPQADAGPAPQSHQQALPATGDVPTLPSAPPSPLRAPVPATAAAVTVAQVADALIVAIAAAPTTPTSPAPSAPAAPRAGGTAAPPHSASPPPRPVIIGASVHTVYDDDDAASPLARAQSAAQTVGGAYAHNARVRELDAAWTAVMSGGATGRIFWRAARSAIPYEKAFVSPSRTVAAAGDTPTSPLAAAGPSNPRQTESGAGTVPTAVPPGGSTAPAPVPGSPTPIGIGGIVLPRGSGSLPYRACVPLPHFSLTPLAAACGAPASVAAASGGVWGVVAAGDGLLGMSPTVRVLSGEVVSLFVSATPTVAVAAPGAPSRYAGRVIYGAVMAGTMLVAVLCGAIAVGVCGGAHPAAATRGLVIETDRPPLIAGFDGVGVGGATMGTGATGSAPPRSAAPVSTLPVVAGGPFSAFAVIGNGIGGLFGGPSGATPAGVTGPAQVGGTVRQAAVATAQPPPPPAGAGTTTDAAPSGAMTAPARVVGARRERQLLALRSTSKRQTPRVPPGGATGTTGTTALPGGAGGGVAGGAPGGADDGGDGRRGARLPQLRTSLSAVTGAFRGRRG